MDTETPEPDTPARPGPEGGDDELRIDVDDPSVGAPPVVAVVVCHDPGDWFEEALAGLAAQEYPSLSVLVIDAGSAVDPTPRVAGVLPDAYVRRLDARTPASASPPTRCSRSSRARPSTCSATTTSPSRPTPSGRWSRRPTGPTPASSDRSWCRWDDVSGLLQVGMAVDKYGHDVSPVERGELDQEQHDAVRDVFSIPGAATLVRADLFAALGGYDPAITFLGEDLDLCWRAQVAGARVLVAPQAVARHVEALGQREGFGVERAPPARRCGTACAPSSPATGASTGSGWCPRSRSSPSSRWSTRSSRAGAGWPPTSSPPGSGTGGTARRTRRPGAGSTAIRAVPDSEVRRLQARGSARFAAFLRGQLGRTGDDRVRALSRSSRDVRRGAAGQRSQHDGRGVGRPGRGPALRFPPLPVRDAALARRSAAAPDPALARARRVALGVAARRARQRGDPAHRLRPARRLRDAAPRLHGRAHPAARRWSRCFVGPIGAARLVRSAGSARASVVAAVVYAAIPLPYDALANGRWGGLVAWSAVPWLVGALARAGGDEPFDRPASRARWRDVLALGLLTALVVRRRTHRRAGAGRARPGADARRPRRGPVDRIAPDAHHRPRRFGRRRGAAPALVGRGDPRPTACGRRSRARSRRCRHRRSRSCCASRWDRSVRRRSGGCSCSPASSRS